jgi:hypothetical protein
MGTETRGQDQVSDPLESHLDDIAPN